MESTLLRARVVTHLKIVAVALAAAFTFVAVGFNAGGGDTVGYRSPSRTVIKATRTMNYAEQDQSTIR